MELEAGGVAGRHADHPRWCRMLFHGGRRKGSGSLPEGNGPPGLKNPAHRKVCPGAGYCYVHMLRNKHADGEWDRAYEWREENAGDGAPTQRALLGAVGDCHGLQNRRAFREVLGSCLHRYWELYGSFTQDVDRDVDIPGAEQVLKEEDGNMPAWRGLRSACWPGPGVGQPVPFFLKNWDVRPLMLHPGHHWIM